MLVLSSISLISFSGIRGIGLDSSRAWGLVVIARLFVAGQLRQQLLVVDFSQIARPGARREQAADKKAERYAGEEGDQVGEI